jgi:hypothetical protein
MPKREQPQQAKGSFSSSLLSSMILRVFLSVFFRGQKMCLYFLPFFFGVFPLLFLL